MKDVTLTILRGLPGSGKSTFAKAMLASSINCVRINKDDLRSAMFKEWSQTNETLLNSLVIEIIRQSLLSGFNVIHDNTNLALSRIRDALGAAKAAKSKDRKISVSVIDFNTSAEICISRDAHRINDSIGETVINNMAKEHLTDGKMKNLDKILEQYGFKN